MTRETTIRRAIAFAVTIVLAVTMILLFVGIWTSRFDPVLTKLVVDNFAAIVGLPFSAAASFVIVTLFHQSEQAVEFEGLGFKFKGAAGEIVLWVLCFLAMTGAVHLLWQHPS